MSDDWHLQLELSTVALTQYASGFLGVQPVPLGDGGTMQAMPSYSPAGLLARPRDPDTVNGQPTTASNCLIAWEGGRGHAIPLGPDPRVASKLPPVNKGGTLLYADRDDGKVTFLNMDGKTGGVTFYVPCASKAIALSIDTTNAGAETFQVVHAAGMALSMIGGGNNAITINNSKGDSYIQLGDDGLTLSAPTINMVGQLAVGIPTPLDYVKNPAALSPDSVVIAGDAFAAWASQLVTSINAIAALLNVAGPVSGAPGAIPLATPFPDAAKSTKFKAA